MVMFILEIMVPHVEIEGVSTEYANVSALTFRVKKVAFQWAHLIPAFVPWKLPPA